VGQYSASQGTPGRQARPDLDQGDPRNHGGRARRWRPDDEFAPATGAGQGVGGQRPKDTVNKAVLRGSGKLEGANYEEIRYEGYGVGGAAVIVDTMTDNRTRTVAEVRHAFSKHGGNLGTDGSVAFQFRHCGHFVFAPGANEDKVMEAALEAGAEDVISDADGSIEVICAPADFERCAREWNAPASSQRSPT
jgi:transcriptional/translational regulatory protein YebC/TACO1